MTLLSETTPPSTAPLPSACVIICCYTERRWDDLLAAVRSVQGQSVVPDRLLVVVDHHDALHHRLRDALPDVQVVPNHHTRGLAGARNTGVEHSREDVVAFLDDDAVAGPEWLFGLLTEYGDPGVVAVGGTIEPRWRHGRPSWFPPEFDWVVGCTYRGMPAARARVRNVIGANMSFRREPVLAAGGFAEHLGRVGTRPVGCEETELCIRVAQRTGGAVVYQPAASVDHHVPRERGSFRYFRARCYGEGLSKAAVTAAATHASALQTERAYVARVLVRAAAVSVHQAIGQRRPAPLARLGALVAGLACAGAGYAVGRTRHAVAGTTSRGNAS